MKGVRDSQLVAAHQDVLKCGRNTGAAKMIPDGVVVLCGEWESGPTPRELSGESYNLILISGRERNHPASRL